MGTYMVTHKMTWLLQQIRNVYYYETTAGEPTDGEWQDIVDEIRGDYDAELKALMSENWQYDGIDRRRVDSAGLLSFAEVPTAGILLGTNVNDSVATQVALLVSVKGTTVKPNRARTYLGGFCEDTLNDSLFTASARTPGEDFVAFQSDLNAIGTNPLQRVAAQWNTGHTAVIASNDLSGATPVASEVPATQRRRRIGRGI